jgi:hypothetical protein
MILMITYSKIENAGGLLQGPTPTSRTRFDNFGLLQLWLILPIGYNGGGS